LKKRWCHWLTTSGIQACGDLIVVHAARGHQIILARMTSKYGSVYLVARRFNSADSSADNSILNGLFLGMWH